MSHLDQCAHASFELNWHNTAKFFTKDHPYDAIILISKMFYCVDCIVFCPVVVIIIIKDKYFIVYCKVNVEVIILLMTLDIKQYNKNI